MREGGVGRGVVRENHWKARASGEMGIGSEELQYGWVWRGREMQFLRPLGSISALNFAPAGRQLSAPPYPPPFPLSGLSLGARF